MSTSELAIASKLQQFKEQLRKMSESEYEKTFPCMENDKGPNSYDFTEVNKENLSLTLDTQVADTTEPDRKSLPGSCYRETAPVYAKPAYRPPEADPIKRTKKKKKKKMNRYEIPEVPKFKKKIIMDKRSTSPWHNLPAGNLGKPKRVKVTINEDLNETHTVPNTHQSSSVSTPESQNIDHPASHNEYRPKYKQYRPAHTQAPPEHKKPAPEDRHFSKSRSAPTTPSPPTVESPSSRPVPVNPPTQPSHSHAPVAAAPARKNSTSSEKVVVAIPTQPRKRVCHQRKSAEPFKKPDFIYVNSIPYMKLECIGRGGSSKVYRVMDCNRKIRALKWVSLERADELTMENYINEIALLKNLRGKDNIVQLIDYELKRNVCMFLLLECGEIDLKELLLKEQKKRMKRMKEEQQAGEREDLCRLGKRLQLPSGIRLNYVRVYWEQMLEAVHTIHEARIVHGDLKPANFVSFQGALKLIDFGIAKAIQNDTTNILRENQIGTINYISPEALIDISEGDSSKQCMKLGRASDIWSLGCILYQMVYNCSPFSHCRNLLSKLHAITDPDVKIKFPPIDYPALHDVLTKCLQRDPKKRPTIPELLSHPFLQ